MKDINNRILLAEDDPNLGTVLKDSLELEEILEHLNKDSTEIKELQKKIIDLS